MTTFWGELGPPKKAPPSFENRVDSPPLCSSEDATISSFKASCSLVKTLFILIFFFFRYSIIDFCLILAWPLFFFLYCLSKLYNWFYFASLRITNYFIFHLIDHSWTQRKKSITNFSREYPKIRVKFFPNTIFYSSALERWNHRIKWNCWLKIIFTWWLCEIKYVPPKLINKFNFFFFKIYLSTSSGPLDLGSSKGSYDLLGKFGLYSLSFQPRRKIASYFSQAKIKLAHFLPQ